MHLCTSVTDETGSSVHAYAHAMEAQGIKVPRSEISDDVCYMQYPIWALDRRRKGTPAKVVRVSFIPSPYKALHTVFKKHCAAGGMACASPPCLCAYLNSMQAFKGHKGIHWRRGCRGILATPA
eukprot:scaffold165728_cov30-Tisochrysis_lutea.AAC.1